jgi:hypothetical protein
MQDAHNHFPPEQRDNLLDELRGLLARKVEEFDVPFDQAFSEISLRALGYDLDAGTLSDGAKDSGIDYWQVEDLSATLFQFKSHDPAEDLKGQRQVGPQEIADIPRIIGLLKDIDSLPKTSNKRTQDFVKELKSSIQRFNDSAAEEQAPFKITVYFCCYARGFTPGAEEEFSRYQKQNQFVWSKRRIEVTLLPVFIDDLLAEQWRAKNTDWRDSNGKTNDSIQLRVRGQIIDSAKSLVFFTSAYDLVNSFDLFGYQIFEPNVRCELKRSRVNEAIRESVKTSRGRKEFKHLNNGITLICASFTKPKTPDGVVRIRQPGVINGLQTVKSIHDAFDELKEKEREDFVDKCELLVRVHTREAVGNYRDLVKSTNNQNPMQPRNLRSNDPEQINFERIFASLNWFYERKEGAWQAFRSDSSLWGSLKGKKIGDFKSQANGFTRNIDNLEMSQAWMSFIGFSDQAIHNKKDIFVDDKYYDLIFKSRIKKHGYDYSFSFSDPAVRDEADAQAPSPHMLLFAYLMREVADSLTPSRKQNRDDSVRRLKIEKDRKEDQDAKLADNAQYIRGLVLAGAKYLFAEFCGLIIFRAVGSRAHEIGQALFRMPSMKALATDRDITHIKKAVEEENYQQSDVIPIIWSIYNYCIDSIVDMPAWRQQFGQAAVRSRFNYSEFNRKTLFQQLEQLDKTYQKRPFPMVWSEGAEKHKGIFKFVAHVLTR